MYIRLVRFLLKTSRYLPATTVTFNCVLRFHYSPWIALCLYPYFTPYNTHKITQPWLNLYKRKVQYKIKGMKKQKTFCLKGFFHFCRIRIDNVLITLLSMTVNFWKRRWLNQVKSLENISSLPVLSLWIHFKKPTPLNSKELIMKLKPSLVWDKHPEDFTRFVFIFF